MTLKQFLQVAGGVVISLIIYAMPLPKFIQWPFIIIFVLLGAAFAFVPIQDRPFEQWLKAFFRSIYSPTLFSWQAPEAPRKYFSEEMPANAPPVPKAGLTLKPSAKPESKLDILEETLLTKISSLFGQASKTPIPPVIGEAVEALVKPKEAMPPTPAIVPIITKEIPMAEPKPAVVIPDIGKVSVPHKGFEMPPRARVSDKPLILSQVPQTLSPSGVTTPSEQAQFSAQASPPTLPENPNIVVGQVLDVNNKIVESAILELRDVLNRPVRALKTNKLGHFGIVTPLDKGKYKLLIEKEGLKFTPISVDAIDKIIPPIVVKAKNAQV